MICGDKGKFITGFTLLNFDIVPGSSLSPHRDTLSTSSGVSWFAVLY